ncbi:MAG: FtsW/RodA/SpoVE family cell cycle protein, partial [Chloroflexota bacterium]
MTLLLRRADEMGLLVWVAALVATGSVAMAAAEATSFDRRQLVIPVAFIALTIGLHAFLVVRRVRGDQLLLPIASALTAIGLVLMQRLQPAGTPLLAQQLTWMIVASGAFAATMLIPRDLTAIGRFKWTWAFLGVALLVSPLLPVIGREINGARIWIGVGRFNFEPWEAVKILMVVFFAA